MVPTSSSENEARRWIMPPIENSRLIGLAFGSCFCRDAEAEDDDRSDIERGRVRVLTGDGVLIVRMVADDDFCSMMVVRAVPWP